MVQISKHPLSKRVFKKLLELLFETMGKNFKNDDFIKVVDELFTSTEKIMVVKRIGILYLLLKNLNVQTISEILHVSTSTVATYIARFYDDSLHIKKLIRRKIDSEKRLGIITDAFGELFIQPGIKKGHHTLKWKFDLEKERRKSI